MGGDSNWRWWEHLNPTCCNQTCFIFLHSGVVGTEKPSFESLNVYHAHLHAPITPYVPFMSVVLGKSHMCG